MATCPRCQQTVSSQTITCPHCSFTLKAHGHPGIPLHRAETGQYLCRTCVYDADDSCTYPQRPYATECTLYRDRFRKPTPPPTAKSWPWRYWLQKNAVWFVLAAIVMLAVLLALR